MQFSDAILDTFFAPHLSQLSKPNLPDILAAPDQRLVFAMNYSLSNVKFRKSPIISAIANGMSHHATAAREYRLAAEKITSYVENLPQHSSVLVLVSAVSHIESCIIHSYIAALCLQRFQWEVHQQQFFRKGDGSEYDRLRALNNRVKHYDEDIETAANNNRAVETSAVWLTDTEIVCRDASLSYGELKSILDAHTSYTADMASGFFKDGTTAPLITV